METKLGPRSDTAASTSIATPFPMMRGRDRAEGGLFVRATQRWKASGLYERTLVYLFPNFRQAVAVDAEIPLTEITEGSRADDVGGFAEPLGHGVDKSIGEIGGGVLAAQVGERVKNDIFEGSLVGKPLDVLHRLPQDGVFSVLFFV